MAKAPTDLASLEPLIFSIRGHRVILDADIELVAICDQFRVPAWENLSTLGIYRARRAYGCRLTSY